MSGPGYGKKKIGRAYVYIHEKGKNNARITHLDIELDALNKIIKPGQATYVQGKEGGIFIGLKKDMIKKAEKILDDEKKE